MQDVIDMGDRNISWFPKKTFIWESFNPLRVCLALVLNFSF